MNVKYIKCFATFGHFEFFLQLHLFKIAVFKNCTKSGDSYCQFTIVELSFSCALMSSEESINSPPFLFPPNTCFFPREGVNQ